LYDPDYSEIFYLEAENEGRFLRNHFADEPLGRTKIRTRPVGKCEEALHVMQFTYSVGRMRRALEIKFSF
jgi:hypothetical protein